jgi:Skp family chaperone for outer membrane proteins
MLVGAIALVVISLYTYHRCFEKKIAYIDIPKVFNGFEMKKEMQEKYKKTEVTRQRVLDSLSLELQMLSRKLQSDKNNRELMFEFDSKREIYFKKQRQNEEDNLALSTQYDKQILGQMSQYMLDYGKANGYDVILGADGQGGLMYADEMLNISDEITEYINDKYKGVE